MSGRFISWMELAFLLLCFMHATSLETSSFFSDTFTALSGARHGQSTGSDPDFGMDGQPFRVGLFLETSQAGG